jgi:hypothetical protein
MAAHKGPASLRPRFTRSRDTSLPVHSLLTYLFTYLLTYLLTHSTQHSPSWEANRFAASQEIPHIFRTRRFITAFTSARHISLFWTSSLQSIPPHNTSWRSVLILSCHLLLGLPSGLFPTFLPQCQPPGYTPIQWFCTLPNKCTIIPKIITVLHVSTRSCHTEVACNQYLTQLHQYLVTWCAPRHTSLNTNTPIHNILLTALQLSISQKALGTLPEDSNVMPKHLRDHHHHKHQGLDHLARSVSRVTAALASVSSVSQLFSFLVDCSGTILKGFGIVAFFAGVRANYPFSLLIMYGIYI